MKKNYLFAVTLVATALLGCSQDELVNSNPEIKSEFTAALETVESRTVLNDANKVQWVVNDDCVSLFEKVNINAKYKVSGVDDNGTATLKYVSHIENADYQSLDKYYAVYPYNDENVIASDGTITAQVPASYIYKDKESCISSALMVARADDKKFRFTNAQGLIRLKLNAETPYVWGKIQSISFTSRDNYLNGTATMSWNTDTPLAEIKEGLDVNQMLTINLDESLKVDLPSKQSGNYAEYYFPIVPITFGEEDLTMTVTFANDKTYSKTIPSEFAIGRKEIITLKHTIGADDFTADIEDEAFSQEIEAATIANSFTSTDGTDIKINISNIIFGNIADYSEIVENNIATVTGGVSVYQVLNAEDNTYTIYYLSENKIVAPADCKNLFNGLKKMTTFDATNLDMSRVENALGMFVDCTNLETIEGIENWDMSNVTNMQSIFYGCNNLKDIDISNWDTSNVTNMRMVFFRCYNLSNDVLKGVENWDVSNVSNFYSMFKHARGLTSLDLSKWDTSSATTMSHMFANIGGLECLDLSGFDTSKVTDMSWMFYDASKLTTIYVGDGWTTKSVDVQNTSRCFYNNQALVGGAGTVWTDVCDMANPARPHESSAEVKYAVVDGGTDNPGLLTYKSIE